MKIAKLFTNDIMEGKGIGFVESQAYIMEKMCYYLSSRGTR